MGSCVSGGRSVPPVRLKVAPVLASVRDSRSPAPLTLKCVVVCHTMQVSQSTRGLLARYLPSNPPHFHVP
eukprot:jgi/Tetstr1/448396/TSEL_003772.t1